MKSYDHIEDFLNDKSFKKWVLTEDRREKEFWEKWQLDHPEKTEVLIQARAILLELDSPGKHWEEHQRALLFLKIKKQIPSNNKTTFNYTSVSTTSRVEQWTRWAIIILLFGTSFLAFMEISFFDSRDQITVIPDEKEEWIIKANPKGQKSTIQLPDGSMVVLNADSEIRFKNNFGQGQRDLYLKGESFFEVAPDSAVAFRVFSGELVTIAIGTSFNINSYERGKEQVQLATGKVKVFKETKQAQAFYLLPGEEVVMQADSTINKRDFDLDKAFLWKKGILLFEQTPISEAINILEQWYGVDFTIKKEAIRDIKVSGRFKEAYLSDVLESLSYAYGFDYQIKNKEVVVIFKPVNL